MGKLTKEDLYSLERYAEIRESFRARIMEHKKNRRLPIGPNATLYFEDALTVQYQVQEMLRIEKIFEAAGIEEELEAYNPLIPDGNNWKATFMIEFGDEKERRKALAQMTGIENCVWMQVAGYEPVKPICNEDLERTTEEKTSSVHFMRFELSQEMVTALESGAVLSAGIDHPVYSYKVDQVPENVRNSLLNDLV